VGWGSPQNDAGDPDVTAQPPFVMASCRPIPATNSGSALFSPGFTTLRIRLVAAGFDRFAPDPSPSSARNEATEAADSPDVIINHT
jgi:hypothetical protein